MVISIAAFKPEGRLRVAAPPVKWCLSEHELPIVVYSTLSMHSTKKDLNHSALYLTDNAVMQETESKELKHWLVQQPG